MLAMIDKGAFPNTSVQPQRPIEFLTDNGFSIIRLSDIDKSIKAVGATHEFLVRDPHEYELDITVQVSRDAMGEIGRRSRNRISNESSYWLSFAERHLAMYLWENDDYPPDAKLQVDDLTIEDIDLARRWDCDT
ncbi:MAG: hypothetical protein QOH41_91 [Blastocatellia bacterium]|jgi:hypothetical protein|nr:hypothetical protein [Blastocatellia bacterium]